jgi:hypothetical protein
MPASTQVATVVVAGLSTPSRYVDKFIVECYADSGLTTKVTLQATGAVWDTGSSQNVQKGILVFKGLVYGTTYYFRAGVACPISGTIAWSSTYSLVAGTATGPSAVTYTGSYEGTTSGIYYTLTPASVPSDIDHYDFAFTLDGSVPASSSLPAGSISPGTTLTFFVGAKPGDRVTTYVRATNTSQQRQVWTSLGTVGIMAVPNDAIVHVGTSPGTGDNYSYRQFSTATYAIVTGDKLEYDVWFDPSCPEFKGGVDFNYTSPSANLRASGLSDQNGKAVLQSTDLTTYAKGRWYHREVSLTSLNGKTIQNWATFLEGDASGAYKAKFANIRITNGNTLKLDVFSTFGIATTTVWTNGPGSGETYTSVTVHTADVSLGSINTAQLISNAVTGDIAALTASARDVNVNLFGNPQMSATPGTVLSAAAVGTLESWTYRQDGTSPTDTPEYRNGGEVRIPKITASGGSYVSVGQTKNYKRFFPGLYYALRVWVRKISSDPTPNGNFNIVMRAYDSSNVLVSTQTIATQAASGITSTPTLVWGTFIWNLVSGAQYYYLAFESTSTNVDLYITQAMLNRGKQVSEYTEATSLVDVAQYAYEGYAFVNDGFTGSNSTALASHYPDTAGFEWVKNLISGTGGLEIQTNAAYHNASAVTCLVLYNNRRPALGNGYAVQADVVVTGTGTTNQVGVMGRYRDTSNFYTAYLRADLALVLDKKVAGVTTNLQTVAGMSGASGTVKLVLTDNTQKVYFNGVLKISQTDSALAFVNTEMAGLYSQVSATGNHNTADNFTATYVQNVGTPPDPPPPPGGGGGGGDPDGGCCVGRTPITTRAGDQALHDLWLKFTLQEWTDSDDLLTYDWVAGVWAYRKPDNMWLSSVRSTLKVTLEGGSLNQCSDDHGIFHSLAEMDWDRMGNISVGSLCDTVEGVQPVESLEVVGGDTVVYHISIPPSCLYVADGILCHNNLKAPP